MKNGSCCILQALSKRIHYGKFVAEAKFTQDPGKFEPHIKAQVHYGGNVLPASMKCDYLCSCAKWIIRL
jgi:hypothetical protein